MYTVMKHAHIMFALISGILFLIRGIWMLVDSPRLMQRWVKIVPHIIDTLLLMFAVGLMMQIHQYPFVHGWLTAKVVALLVYIVAGTVALKRGKTKMIRAAAFGFSLLCYLYILSVAFNHHSLGALIKIV
ncbi:MAG: regulator SirB [Gammaproteobacteria bacterium]|nr:MAG: regulator SirB [Gammaproteobacteria bacterium]